MKKMTILWALFSVCAVFGQNSPAFEVKYSKPLSVLRFLEAGIRENHASPTYKALIDKQFSDPAFRDLLRGFESIRYNYSYQWPNVPASRRTHRNVSDIVNTAAVNAANIDDFARRIIGLMPNEDYIRFVDCLKKAEVYHDQMFSGYDEKIQAQVAAYDPYKPTLTDIFRKASAFYGTQWSGDVPFVVCLYPMPARTGSTSATPHGNALVCGFLADNPRDYRGRLGVVTHEMCHILYDGQAAVLQQKIERWFMQHPSPYRRMAYSYIDEGLATAIGNGWAYEKINNTVDTSSWYNDTYIDAYGHALFPLVKRYIEQGKSLDSLFVDEAIQLFAKALPNSIYEYTSLMNNLTMFGTMPDADIQQTTKVFQQNFRISSYSLSTPLDQNDGEHDIKNTAGTKLLLIESDIDKHWAFLTGKYPIFRKKLAGIKPKLGQCYAFLNEKDEAVIILVYQSPAGLDALLKVLVEKKLLDTQKIVQN